MSYHAFNQNVEQKLVHLIPPISDSAKIGLFVHALDIIIKAGKYFPIISVSLTGLNLIMAINDFLTNNIGFGLLNSLFVTGGLIFLAQTMLIDKSHHLKPFHS